MVAHEPNGCSNRKGITCFRERFRSLSHGPEEEVIIDLRNYEQVNDSAALSSNVTSSLCYKFSKVQSAEEVLPHFQPHLLYIT